MKRILMLLLILTIFFSLIACTSTEVGEEGPGEGDVGIVEEDMDEPKEEEEGDEIVDPTPKTDSQEVVLYFANEKYIETGDESLEKMVEEKREIDYGDVSLEEAIVKELMKGPETEGLTTSIPDTVKLLGVEISNGTVFVNFAQDGLFGGSLQEGLTIGQIVNSLLELDSVGQVQFLVDGEKVETLMGHYSTMEPFNTKQDL